MTPQGKLENAKQKQRELENARHGAQAELSEHDSAWEARYQDSVAQGETYSPEQAAEDKAKRCALVERIQHIEQELAAVLQIIPELEAEVFSEQAQKSRDEADGYVREANETALEFETAFNEAYTLLHKLNTLHNGVKRAESLVFKRAQLAGKVSKDFPATREFRFDLQSVNRQVLERMANPSQKPKPLHVMKGDHK